MLQAVVSLLRKSMRMAMLAVRDLPQDSESLIRTLDPPRQPQAPYR